MDNRTQEYAEEEVEEREATADRLECIGRSR